MPRGPNFAEIIFYLTSLKMQPDLLKQPLKTQKRLKELEIMY